MQLQVLYNSIAITHKFAFCQPFQIITTHDSLSLLSPLNSLLYLSWNFQLQIFSLMWKLNIMVFALMLGVWQGVAITTL